MLPTCHLLPATSPLPILDQTHEQPLPQSDHLLLPPPLQRLPSSPCLIHSFTRAASTSCSRFEHFPHADPNTSPRSTQTFASMIVLESPKAEPSVTAGCNVSFLRASTLSSGPSAQTIPLLVKNQSPSKSHSRATVRGKHKMLCLDGWLTASGTPSNFPAAKPPLLRNAGTRCLASFTAWF